MRSIKSELYLFVKKIILGGTHTDTYIDLGKQPKTKEQTFEKVSYVDGDSNTIECQNYMFYNSDLNEEYFASVLFDFQDINPDIHSLKTQDTKDSATEKETVRFSLFIPYYKLSADMLENDYLDHLDFCEAIRVAVSGKNFLGISTIKKVGETHDNDSRVIMGKELIFETQVTNYGMTSDSEVPTPIETGVTAIIVNKVS